MSIQNSPFTRVKKPLKSDMNVVPYIDVMLVLLVIFMVTAPMMTAGLTVDLPDTPSDALSVSQQLPAIVTIKPNGEYYLRIGDAADRLLTLDDIERELTNTQSSSKQPLTVLLNGDEHVPYGNIVSLMSRLQKAGLRQVGLLTETPQ